MILIKKIKQRLRRAIFPNDQRYKKISYSQCGEDLIIKFIFDALKINKPSFIDIGAHHPFHINNTALLYKVGARGINIEPNAVLFTTFLEHRKGDVNLNLGIADRSGILDFYIMSASTLSTFSKKEALSYRKEGNYSIESVRKVEVEPLKNIIERFSNGKFPHFLNIDAEGVDSLIIHSIDFEENYPLVICVETISFSTRGKGVKNKELINYICEQGYLMYADTYINSIFVRESKWKK